MNYKKDFLHLLQLQIEQVKLLNKINEESLNKVISTCHSTNGKIIFCGLGKSFKICDKLTATYNSLGIYSQVLHATEALHGDLGIVNERDCIIFISNSGKTRELLDVCHHIRKIYPEMNLISITNSRNSPLAKLTNFHLDLNVTEELCPYNLAPTSTTTSTLILGDIIGIILSKLNDFKPRDFAKFHPGGSLGKKLLTTCKDLMHIDKLPILKEDMTILDALLHISEGGFGMGILICQKTNNILGIISDGDIRRLILNNINITTEKVVGFINKSYQYVNPTDSTELAENIFIEKKIVTLLVQQEKKLLGLIQIFDL